MVIGKLIQNSRRIIIIMNARLYVFPIILFVAVLCRTSPGLGGWVTTVLDIPGGISGIHPNYGGSSDIAIDSSGNVHIAHSDYTNKQLRYVTNSSGTWSGISVDDFAPSNSTVLIDATGQVHIYYLNKNADSNLELIHATLESGIWSLSSTVIDDSLIEKAKFNNESIFLDDSNHVHVAYSVEDSSYDEIVRYATNASGSWTVTDVYNGGYESIGISSIVLDAARKVHISFAVRESSGNYLLKYAANESGVFVLSDVFQSGKQIVSPSISLDKYNRPGIAFMGWDPVGKINFLKFASRFTGSWTVENVEYPAGFTQAPTCSLVIDSGSKAHISYVYATDVFDAGHSNMYAIKYASNASGSWQTSFIDNNPTNGFTNILFSMINPATAVDSSGNLHVSYEAGHGNENSYISYRVLKYATNRPPKFDSTGTWTYQRSGNWYGGAIGCTGDQDEAGSGLITQNGRVVVGKLGGITSNGYTGASTYEMYSKFVEAGGGITKLLTYLSITSGTTASGTILWFWDGDRPCYGGSNIDLTKIDGPVVPIDYPEPTKPSSTISTFVPILLLDN